MKPFRSICAATSGAGLGLLLLLTPVGPLARSAASQTSDSTPKPATSVRRPSVVKAVVRKLADTLGSAGAATLIDRGLGSRGRAVGQMLGGGAAGPCSAGPGAGLIPGATPGPVTAGSKLVGLAKKAAHSDADSVPTRTADPCSAPAANPSAAMAMPGGMANQAMMATPLGLAVTAAPLAAAGLGAAAKGVKKLLGGGPQTAMGMLKAVEGKGRVVLKGVRFVAHTDVLEPGYEGTLTTLAEALGQVPGPYALYIEPEADKGADPERPMAAKRIAKIWATLVASGVKAAVFVADVVVPDSLVKTRKPAKPGDAAVELWKVPVTR